MVKIKEGYIMSASEKKYYDLDDARLRRTSGRVDYFFKPQTKYPPRIYVFMQAELWCDRNRRPMGLFNALPFMSREMNKEELEYHHFNWRLCYYQYEDWDKLLYAEEKEAEVLDAGKPGTGSAFLEKLRSFRERYPLKEGTPLKLGPALPFPPEGDIATLLLNPCEAEVLDALIQYGNTYPATAIGDAMGAERQGLNRNAVNIALRFLYQNTVLPAAEKKELNLGLIKQKQEISVNRTRKNFVRRVFKRSPLFALAEIWVRYPEYTEHMLLADLQRKAAKPKRKKRKPVTDLRRCQLEKLATKLRSEVLDGNEYQKLCCRIVSLQEAHDQRLPISLTVKLAGETLVYSFPWKCRENIIKSFVAMANTAGMTHVALQQRYQEILKSPNNF